MKLGEIRKALVPLVVIALTWGANALGIAPDFITTEFAAGLTGVLVAVAAAVFGIKNDTPPA